MEMNGPALPRLTWSLLGHTQFTLASVLLATALGLYLLGVLRARRLGTTWAWWKVATFVAAVVVLWIATESVVGIYDMTLFSIHMVQHVLLVMTAAPLLAASAPVDLLMAATSGRTNQLLRRALDSTVAGIVGHPVFGFLAYTVLIPAFHLTHLFDQAMASLVTHHLEEVAFIVVGYLFWRPVVGVESSKHPLAPGLRLIYLLLSIPVDTFTGLALVSSQVPPFVAFSVHRPFWAPPVLADIHDGGAIMWVCGDILMMVAMIPCALVWLRDEESKTVLIDRAIDEGTYADPGSAWRPRVVQHFPTAPPRLAEADDH